MQVAESSSRIVANRSQLPKAQNAELRPTRCAHVSSQKRCYLSSSVLAGLSLRIPCTGSRAKDLVQIFAVRMRDRWR
jgi:hypothetical protein